MAWMVGSVTQVSVHNPAKTIFFRPLFSIAATKFLSSQASIEVRSIGTWFGKTALICGQRFPLKLLLSTVLRTTGSENTLAAFASATVLLMVDQRDHAIIRGQQSFLAAFHRHERLLF